MSTADMIAQAKAAGFHGPGLALAVAVSLAEDPSSDPNAVNHNSNGTIDRGYWQINSVHGSLSTFDPAGNARAAYQLSKGGTDWSAWTTAHNGRAYAAMPQATKLLGINGVPGQKTANPDGLAATVAAAKQFTGQAHPGGKGSVFGDVTGAVTGPVSTLTDGISSAVDAAKQALGFIAAADVWIANPHNWLRVVEVLGGLAGILIGVNMLAGSGVGGPVGALAHAGAKATHAAGKAASVVAIA